MKGFVYYSARLDVMVINWYMPECRSAREYGWADAYEIQSKYGSKMDASFFGEPWEFICEL